MDYKKFLDKILESNEFSSTDKYKNLLQFLVEQSFKGEVPKELTIAHEVFGMSLDSNQNGDINIRVYVYNLRKKLDSYYRGEGHNDPFQFTIPKGRYKVELIEKKVTLSAKIKKSNLFLGSLSAILGVVLIMLLLYTFSNRSLSSKKFKSYIVWNSLICNDLPTHVVLGDYYLMQDTQMMPERIKYVRDVTINSDADFYEFADFDSNSHNTYIKSKHSLLGKFAPICLMNINKVLPDTGDDFEVILGSEFNWNYMNNSNLIFVGTFKTAQKFSSFFESSNFNYSIYPNQLDFHQLDPDTLVHLSSHDSDLDNAYETDYSVVMKVKGTNNSSVLFILASRDIGLMATTEYLTNPETLNEFNKLFPNDLNNASFEACFKIQGLYRHVVNIEIQHLNIIDRPVFTDE